MPPPTCRFWTQGNCRYGSNCKFYHPDEARPATNNNRYAALQVPENNTRNSGFNNRNNGYQNQASQAPRGALPYQLDKAAITIDLSSERPQWILSAYGPGRLAPVQLFGGEQREKSFEEMRLYHYQARAANAEQQAIQEANALYQQSEQQIQTILNNVDAAVQFIIDGEKSHPNRLDIVSEINTSGKQVNPLNAVAPAQISPNPNPFGPPAQPNSGAFGAPSGGGAFGQPSALGQKPTPFGAPSQPGAFGAPSQPTGAFGAPSALGQKPNPFGAPSTGAFGSPSTLGQNPNPFGTPSPNPFGQPSQPAAAFGAQPAVSSAFGAPSQPPVAANPFGGVQSPQQNPFGTPQQPSPLPQPFGVPTSAPNPFGQPSQPAPTNPFGNNGNTAQQSQAPVNPFTNGAQPFVQNPMPSNPFLNGNQSGFPTSAQPNTFMNGAQSSAQNHINGGPANGGATSLAANTNFGASAHPPLESYSTKGPDGRFTSFKGKRVVYKEGQAGTLNPDGTWSDIWFPEGPPRFTSDAQMPDNEYDDTTRAAYEAMSKTGKFEDAVMPLLPPKVEWISWDF